MSIARRIKSAEGHLPKPPDSAAEKLRRRLSIPGQAAFFAGIFGDYSDYLAAASCPDRDGAVAVAELVDARTDGVAGAAYLALSLDVLTEENIIRLQALLQTSPNYTETAIAELREILFRTFPTDCGFPRGQLYCN